MLCYLPVIIRRKWRLSTTHRSVRLGVLVLLSVLAVAAVPARADWIFAHGTAAVIQQDTAPGLVSAYYLGWGLDVKLKKGTSAWFHFPMNNPALDNYYTDKIQLVFRTQNSNAYIAQIDIWDGAIRFESLKGKWWSSGASKTVTIILSQKWKISRGLGISIQLKNAVGGERTVGIESIGAHMDDK
jgi:hypothetical protein